MTSASTAARHSRGSLVVRLALAIALIASAATLGIQAPASAANNGTWAAFPLQHSDSISPRVYFIYSVNAGESLSDVLFLENFTTQPLTLKLYPADAVNAAGGGGFSVKPQAAKQTGVGSWVKLSRTSVILPAHGHTEVPFTMTVPTGTTPGDHAGGIVSLNPILSNESGSSQGGINNTIGVQQQIAVRLYARVAGPLSPQLSITKTSLKVKPATFPLVGSKGSALLTYTIANTGNQRLTPTGHIVFTGLFGRTIHDLKNVPIPEILPGQQVTLTEAVSGMPALDQVHARITLSYPPGSTSADVLAWSISWPMILIILLLVIAVVVAVWWRRRRRTATGGRRSSGGRRAASHATSPTPVG